MANLQARRPGASDLMTCRRVGLAKRAQPDSPRFDPHCAKQASRKKAQASLRTPKHVDIPGNLGQVIPFFWNRRQLRVVLRAKQARLERRTSLTWGRPPTGAAAA